MCSMEMVLNMVRSNIFSKNSRLVQNTSVFQNLQALKDLYNNDKCTLSPSGSYMYARQLNISYITRGAGYDICYNLCYNNYDSVIVR